MDKPIKPTDLIPRSFGGVKNNFSASLQATGYEDGVPAIYGGDNLNYQLDATGKELDYCEKICDYINAIPINKTPVVDANNKLVYTQYDIRVYNSTETYNQNDYLSGFVNGEKHIYRCKQNNTIGQALSNDTYFEQVDIMGNVKTIGRNIGEIVTSPIPLTDASLHLLDGTLLSGSGTYSAVIDYFAGLYNDTPSANYFCTEIEWQSEITAHGECGKFVYNSTNNTLRLPKLTGILEGTITANELGDTVEAGLPNITGSITRVACTDRLRGEGAFSGTIDGSNDTESGRSKSAIFTFDASRSNSIYGNSPTVQPQTVKVYYYIVVATSTKTDIEVDIDEIATDLNGKADVDLTNVNDSGTSRGAGWAMPSSTYDDLTLGASGTTYTAPANGWFMLAKSATATGQYMRLATSSYIWTETGSTNNNQTPCVYVPVKKGDIVTATYALVGSYTFKFIYAIGSESEAN